jgi:hypothetical protein
MSSRGEKVMLLYQRKDMMMIMRNQRGPKKINNYEK